MTGKDPVADSGTPAWQVLSDKVVQWALYALMTGLPILGWLTHIARRKPVQLFSVELPMLIGNSKALAQWLMEIHSTLVKVGFFLIG